MAKQKKQTTRENKTKGADLYHSTNGVPNAKGWERVRGGFRPSPRKEKKPAQRFQGIFFSPRDHNKRF